MKNKPQTFTAVLALMASLTMGRAQGTAFTYQGRLTEGGAPAAGTYDLRFALFDAPTWGSQMSGVLTNAAAGFSNGLFTVTLDFGSAVWDGSARWLEVGVRTNGGASFFTLVPRLLVASSPYAITAAKLSGPLPASGLSGTYSGAVSFVNPANTFQGIFSGNGLGLSNLNAATLGGVSSSNFWQTDGNNGANANWYLGTADYQPFELRVNKARGLRILPTANGWPNVIAGSSNNVIDSDATAASINGGAWNDIRGRSGSATISSGQRNRIGTNSAGSFVGGGQWNELGDGSVRSVISGGYSNRIRGFTGTNAAAIAQGITDGTSNTILIGETLPGNATIGGGYANTIGSNCAAGVISGGEQNLLGDGSVRGVIGGGRLNQIQDGTANTIMAGEQNSIAGTGGFSAIGGGRRNDIRDGTANTIFAGEQNLIQNGTGYSSIGGGRWNTNTGNYAMIPGGAFDVAAGDYSFAAGRRAKAMHPGAFVWADAGNADFASTRPNEFNVRADGSVRFITSGAGMTLDGQPVLAGTVGSTQLAGTYLNAVAFNNAANAFNGDGSGLANLNASSLTSGTVPDARLSGNVVWRNAANNFTGNQTVTGGQVGIGTTAPRADLHVRGQNTNGVVLVTAQISDANAEVRLTENASATLGMILRYAGASNGNPFQIVGLTTGGVETAPHVTILRDSGNVGIGTPSPTNKLHVNGGITCTALVQTSDRNAKEDFQPVSPAEVLEKVAALPITRWKFKSLPDGQHLGPMAQDFHAAFSLGGSDTTITAIDADGVALAAIQGLHQLLKQKDSEVEALRKSLADLQEQVSKLNHHLHEPAQSAAGK